MDSIKKSNKKDVEMRDVSTSSEELTDEGLSEEGLSQIQSVSSAILDEGNSEAEEQPLAKLPLSQMPHLSAQESGSDDDDSVNVTIRPAKALSGITGKAPARKNLTKGQRFRLKQLRQAGLTREDALQQLHSNVIPATPSKRSREGEATGSEEKPCLKKTKRSICPRERVGQANKQETPNVTKAAAVDGDGFTLVRRGAKHGPSKGPGEVNRNKLSPAVGIKMGIINHDFPNTPMTTSQLDTLQTALLMRIGEQCNDTLKPKFSGCSYRSGYMVLTCKDQATADWIQKIIPSVVPWEAAKLVAMKEDEIPRLLNAWFPQGATFEDEAIKRLILGQNEEISLDKWTIIDSRNVNGHREWTMSVDNGSMRRLQERNLVLNFGWSQAKFRSMDTRWAKKHAKPQTLSTASATGTRTKVTETAAHTAGPNPSKPGSSGVRQLVRQHGPGGQDTRSVKSQRHQMTELSLALPGSSRTTPTALDYGSGGKDHGPVNNSSTPDQSPRPRTGFTCQGSVLPKSATERTQPPR